MSSDHTYKLILGLGIALLVTGCAATKSIKSTNRHDPVRKIDFTKAPELGELAERTRQFGNAMYPKVCALLLDDTASPPRQFDVILGSLKSRNTAETHADSRRIYINSDYLTNSADLNERFEKVFVHEMAHMAVEARGSTTFLWQSRPAPHGYWDESIADYAFYKLVGTNGWNCPECNTRFPHYTSGYACGGAFLLYLESKHGTNLVRELGATLRRGSYSDSFFANATGQNLEVAWADFQKTGAFKPGAKRAFELQQALGFVNGQVPKNVERRFKKLIDQHPDVLMKRAVAATIVDGKPIKDISTLMALYLYFTQPGGTPEHFLSSLLEQGQLPGFSKGQKGRLSTTIAYDPMATETFPMTRTLTGSKTNDTSIYHYTVICASEGAAWRLEKAWRTGRDGKVIEEFSPH